MQIAVALRGDRGLEPKEFGFADLEEDEISSSTGKSF